MGCADRTGEGDNTAQRISDQGERSVAARQDLSHGIVDRRAGCAFHHDLTDFAQRGGLRGECPFVAELSE